MKTTQYRDLVAQRKACRRCSGLRNPSEGSLGQFDSEEIGPWSRLHGDLDAAIMVVGQDWGDTSYYKKHSGLDDLRNPTMRTLEKLLASIGVSAPLGSYGETNSGLFLTNAILCLKQGGLQGSVERDWFASCGKHFLKSQIDIVSPKVVVALGQRAYEGILGAYGLKRRQFRESVESEEGINLPNGSRLFAAYHCGNKILNTHRKFEQQVVDWARIGRAIQNRD